MGISCFKSKAASLVLIWTLCVCISLWSVNELTGPVFRGLKVNNVTDMRLFVVISVTPLIVLMVSIPLSGWLADSKYGNFKVFRAGSIMLFIGCVLISICITVVLTLVTNFSQTAFVVSAVLGPLSNIIGFIGGGTCLVTVFQLGLDQMPDASSHDIVSYIAWFCTALFFGLWTSNVLVQLLTHCTNFLLTLQGLGLLPVLCMSIVLSSMFIFSSKYLIFEPGSPQSLRFISSVLKFAFKHKSPLNRSAFTFYEEKIPSRLDLAKSRYGGPFTLEQVEDVKTVLRLLLYFSPLWIIAFSTNMYSSLYLITNPIGEWQRLFAADYYLIPQLQNETCMNHVFSKFTYNPLLCWFVAVLVFKIGIGHCIGCSWLSIQRQSTLLLTTLSICNIGYTIIGLIFTNGDPLVWSFAVYSALSNAVFALLVVCAIEFVCAQSPYRMRGFMSGIACFTMFMFVFLGYALSLLLTHLCYSSYCVIIQFSIGAALSVVGFLLQIFVAHWYKNRVRDEEYNLHYEVEQIYDRLLS